MKIVQCGSEDIDSMTRFYDDTVEKMIERNINWPRWKHKKYPSFKTVSFCAKENILYRVEKDGRIAAAFILNDDPWSDYEMGNWNLDLKLGEYMVIHSLAVDPDCMRQGIGNAILDFAKEEGLKRGMKAVRVDVVPDNEPACALYERYGFKNCGISTLGRSLNHIPEFMLYELPL